MKKWILILLAISISGCSARTISVQAELPKCADPVELVKMGEEHRAIMALLLKDHPELIKHFNKREDQLQARIDTLCDIIESTQK